jgi:hypothetical protein
MKKFITYIIICQAVVKIASAQNWVWSKQIGGINRESPSHKMVIDNNNNVYFSGFYRSNPCYFNSDTVNILSGYSDFFIAKYDASGNELWEKNFGGTNTQMQGDGAYSVVFNSVTNSIFMSGAFVGPCSFGSNVLTSNQSDGFIARLDLDGNVLWVKTVSSSGNDECLIDVDDEGNVYSFIKLANSGSIDTVASLPDGLYLAKFDSGGSLISYDKKFNTNGSAVGYVACYTDLKVIQNKIFCIGLATVTSFIVDTVSVATNFSPGQVILSCFDTSLIAIWTKPCADAGTFVGYWITSDDDKNSYITGAFLNMGIFGTDTLYSASPGSSDMFFAKYDSSGNEVWAKQTLATVGAGGEGIALGSNGNIYLAGSFRGTVHFGNDSITNTAPDEMFMARYTPSGNCIGVRHFGEAGGSAVVVDNGDNIYVGGLFANTITLDANPSLTSYGNYDIFIAKTTSITGTEEERPANNRLFIYANPTTGTCNVTIPDEFQHEKDLTLQVFDNTGKLLQQTKVEMEQSKIKVNLLEETKGIYNVILSNGKKSYSGKIVFE